MRNVTDIIQEIAVQSSVGAKEEFCKKLKQYMHKKYKGINEHTDVKRFTDAYTKYLLKLEKFCNPNGDPKRQKSSGLPNNNIANWLDPTTGISRESIIDIAFILADSKKKDGEKIANDLLKSAHHPQLHASSELELFYIYALSNGLGYVECLKLYRSYLERDKVELPDTDNTHNGVTSTFFHDNVVNIKDEESLFSFVDSKRQYFGTASLKMNGYFSEKFNEMINNNYKIVIKSYENVTGANKARERNVNNADVIADVIVKALDIKEDLQKNEKAKIIADLKKTQKKVEKKPLVLYVCGDKNAASISECVLSCGGNVKMRKLSLIEMKLDFYLFYACDDSLCQFLKRFSETSIDSYIYVDQKKGEREIKVDSRRYDKYFVYRSYVFYPIKAQSFSSVSSGIDAVLKNEKTFSREGMLLWLLYYYGKFGGIEKYCSLLEINDIIYKRYFMLNEDDYFDRIIIMLLKFKLINGRVYYDKEEIDPTSLKTNNIHELRHSIIRLLEPYFKSEFAVNMFGEKDNITTSLAFESTKGRLGIK